MSLAVVKEHVLTISTDMWVLAEDSSPSRRFESQLKIRVPVEDSSHSPSSESKSKIRVEVTIKQLENCKFFNPKLTMNRTHAKKQTAINSEETRRTKCSRNDRYLKNRVASDKYYNMIFHVHNHK